MTMICNEAELKLGSEIQITKGEDIGLRGKIIKLDFPSNERGKVLTNAYRVVRIKWEDGVETNAMCKHIIMLGGK